MTMATEKIFIGIDNDKIELTGADKEAFLEQRAKDQAELGLLEAEQLAKQQKRIDAITKLGEASGLTTDEINSILNI
jgi:predicted regulator of Ras-like GTPase activity (Roadblock/LC7/MglB family)